MLCLEVKNKCVAISINKLYNNNRNGGDTLINNLKVKNVDFQGDSLLAIKNEKNKKIYVAVNYICKGLGLSEGQFRRQKQNLGVDVVLKRGVTILKYPTNGGDQDVLCIELDFLPLWLAKISITPKMKKNSPELVEKLVEYQMKAKNALSGAFTYNVAKVSPMSYKDSLIALIKSIEVKEGLINKL